MGGIFFVRSENTTIRTFEDMKGKTAVAVAPNAFGGYRVHLGELNARLDYFYRISHAERL